MGLRHRVGYRLPLRDHGGVLTVSILVVVLIVLLILLLLGYAGTGR